MFLNYLGGINIMFNQYIKIGIGERYLNYNYLEIINYIGRRYCNEINGNNYYGNKGRRKIIEVIKADNDGKIVSKSQIKAFCYNCKNIITRRKYLKISRYNTMLILNAIVKLIENDKYAINMFENYCNNNNINEINRIYRTALIPKHYDELKNNVNSGDLRNDYEAVSLYENLKGFTKKYKK